jgi:[ribosomal protein S18]-alanine N-acetyltransferase
MSDRSLRLVQAGTAHLALIEALHAECFAESWGAASFGELIASGAIAWLALEGERAVGLLVTRAAVGEGEIITLGILPAARRRGIARRLLEHGLAEAAGAGCRMIYLEVGCGNEAALTLYRTAGFRDVGRRRGYYQQRDKAPEDAVIMRKDY